MFPSAPGSSPGSRQSTVYFDGSCALCRAEIAHYRRQEGAGALGFVDVSEPTAAPPRGLSRQQVLQRFHVGLPDGRVVSGAAAFVEVWSRLPRWRWLARASRKPGVLPVLELAYRLFLPVRPFLSRLVGAFGRLRTRRGSR